MTAQPSQTAAAPGAPTIAGHPRRRWIRAAVVALLFASASGGFIYWMSTSGTVYIDTAQVEAPLIALSATTPGVLQEVYAHEGDAVGADVAVARVGNELVKSGVAGLIVSVDAKLGATVSPADAVATMIDPSALRVVGRLDEDKGLSRIAVGDQIVFTLDAFGGREFSGVVDEISPTSRESGIVFNISNTRQVQQFDVKARFDAAADPEIKNGMSARMRVYTR